MTAADSLVPLLLFLLSAAVHEAGHILTAKIFGIPMRFFRFCQNGAVMSFDFSHTTYLREAAVHLGGSLFAMTGAVLSVFLLGERAHFFLGISVVLSAVNLMPIRGTDGGACLKALLLTAFLPDTAEKISGIVSWCMWSVLWGAVLWIEMRVRANLTLLLFIIGFLLHENDKDYR